MSPREESWMPRAYPPGFRRRVVELARLREKPIARSLRTWGSPGRACTAGCGRPMSTRATERA